MARSMFLMRLLQFLLPATLILGLANWGAYLVRPASLWITIPIAGMVLGIAASQAWSGKHHSPFMNIGRHANADTASGGSWNGEVGETSGMTDRSLIGLPMSGCDITKPFG